MKNKKLLAVCTAMILAVALAGCASKPVSSGAFAGNTYANEFFGLSYNVPDGWYIASKDDMKTLFNVSEEAIGSEDKDAEKKMELSKQNELYLSYVSMYPLDAQQNNPNMNLIVENLSLYGAVIKDGNAYAQAATDDLKAAYDGIGLPYEIGEISTQKINGMDFALLDSTLTGDGYSIYQRVLCTVKNNYALVFTLTWYDDAELEHLQKMVDTIAFK